MSRDPNALLAPLALLEELERLQVLIHNVKVTVTDPQALQHLKLSAVRAYLQQQGWQPLEDDSSVWKLASTWFSTSLCAAVPEREDVPDYATCMSKLLVALALVEQRSQLGVLYDIWQLEPQWETDGINSLPPEGTPASLNFIELNAAHHTIAKLNDPEATKAAVTLRKTVMSLAVQVLELCEQHQAVLSQQQQQQHDAAS